MAGYNFLDDFQTDLGQWLTSRLLPLPSILDLEGGWEHWMQVDFLAWLTTTKNLMYDFRREVSGTGLRFDWVINSNSIGYQMFAIELKCQTAKSAQNSFKSSVIKDIAKLKKCTTPDLVKQSIVAVIGNDLLSTLYALGYQVFYTFNTNVYFLRLYV